LLVGEEVLGLFFLVLLSFHFQFRSLLIEFHELGEIELGFLEELNLLHENVLEWEDLSAFLLDFISNIIRDAKYI
jgi:hypothetical protein